MSSSGEVYCKADEGHVKIEPTHLQHCCVDDITTSETATDQSGHHDECVDCSDLPIDSPQFHQRTKSTQKYLFTFITLPVNSLFLNLNSIGAEISIKRLFHATIGEIEPSTTISILLC